MTFKTMLQRLLFPDQSGMNDDDTGDLLADAQAKRREAERKLEMTRLAGREVNQVSTTQRRLRSENHFSARMREAMGRPDNG